MPKKRKPSDKPTITVSPLNLTIESARDKDNKETKNASGDILYKQHDSLALIQLLNVIDAKQFGMKGYKNFLKIQDKVEIAWRDDNKQLSLTVDEIAFLKDYLAHYEQKSRKDAPNITPFLIRTLVHIMEQLSEDT